MERSRQNSEHNQARPVISFNPNDETGSISAIIARAQELLDGEEKQRFMQMVNGLKGDGEVVRFHVYDDLLALINNHVALEDTSGVFDQYAPLDAGRTVDGTATPEQ